MAFTPPTFGYPGTPKKANPLLSQVLQQGPPSSGGFLENHPGVMAGIASTGSYLNATADRDQQAKAAQFGVGQYKADTARDDFQRDRSDQLNRATSVAQMDPLGTSQMFAAKQALISKILGGVQNVHSTPGDPGVAAAMGHRTLPSLPQFSPADLEKYFGDAATQTSIAQRQKQMGQIDPNAPMFDLSSIYGKSADGSENAFDTDIRTNAAQAGDAMNSSQNNSRLAVSKAIAEMEKASKGQSKKSKVLGAIPGLALSALSFL